MRFRKFEIATKDVGVLPDNLAAHYGHPLKPYVVYRFGSHVFWLDRP